MLLFDNNKMKMARKPGKKQKENAVACTGEGKRWKENIWDESREVKTGTVLELSFGGIHLLFFNYFLSLIIVISGYSAVTGNQTFISFLVLIFFLISWMLNIALVSQTSFLATNTLYNIMVNSWWCIDRLMLKTIKLRGN